MASVVRCPICKKRVSRTDPYIPFCSDRCRLIDLGNWASEKYVVSSPVPADELDELEHSEDFDSPESPSR